MTALAGCWRFSGAPAESSCRAMLEAQRVYSTGAAAIADLGAIAVGRRLFAVLDEDRFDDGPVTGGDGSLCLVADIRLDNRDSLQHDLGLPGAQASRLSDAGLLMRCWERWGEASLDRIVGDFAFALWDARLRRLVLARDALGQRPLHYHRAGDFFAFASMPKGLHALERIPRAPNEDAVAAFLALMPQEGSDSFFHGIERVEPGTLVTVEQGRLERRRYWRPDLSPLRLRDAGQYVEAVRGELDRAVACRLRGAGTAVGAHLSAGLDSSAVAATAAGLLAGSGGKVVAYTAVPRAGFPVGPQTHYLGDEGPLAGEVAALYPNMEHVRVSTDGGTPADALERDHFLYERPVRNLCNNVWTGRINDLARERGVRVMLSGTMGNMSFSHHGLEVLPQLLRRGRLLRLARETRRYSRWTGLRWKSAMGTAVVPFLPQVIRRRIAKRQANWIDDLCRVTGLSERFVKEGPLAKQLALRGSEVGGGDPMNAASARLATLQAIDPGNYNKGMLGGWGLDSRDPTADRRLVELCLRIPSDQFFVDGVPRSLARRVLAHRLPSSLISERRRGSQAVDWHEGMTGARPALAEIFAGLSDCAPAARFIDIARMRGLIADWPAPGEWGSEPVAIDYRYAMLRGLSAGEFVRRALEDAQ